MTSLERNKINDLQIKIYCAFKRLKICFLSVDACETLKVFAPLKLVKREAKWMKESAQGRKEERGAGDRKRERERKWGEKERVRERGGRDEC